MFRQEDIDRLMEQLNIVDVVGEFVELKKSGANYKGLCPFHADNNPSFSVNPQKNICKCFVCGAGGTPISFYAKYKKISFTEAVRELAKKYHIPIQESNRNREEDEKYERYYTIMDAAHEYFQKTIFENSGREALDYLRKREVGPKLIQENNLGYASPSWEGLYNHLIAANFEAEELELLGLVKKNEAGKYYDAFRNRIIFPIYSTQRRVLAFGGRSLEQGKEVPKYINSPDTPIFKKGKGLYGLERAQTIKKKNYAILMEGYMDVLSTVSYGFDTAIAPLGTALTKEQVLLLKRYTENVILSFDADNAGQMAVERAIFLLKQENFNIRVLTLQGAKDPDEFLKKFGKEAFLQQIRESMEAFDFLYEYYKKEYSLEDIMSKQKFIERFQEFFYSLGRELEQELYLQKFAGLLEMEAASLRSILFPRGRKNIVSKEWKPEEKEEILESGEQELSDLEEISLQIGILDLQHSSSWETAKYYQFLKTMLYQHPLSQKVFVYLKNLEEEGQAFTVLKLRQLLEEENQILLSQEKDFLFELLTKCLEREAIEEQRSVVFRSWARQVFRQKDEVSFKKTIQLKKIEQSILRSRFEIETFLEKYQIYLELREGK